MTQGSQDETPGQVEVLLKEARVRGDARGECAALADLGVLHIRSGEFVKAVETLENAEQLAVRLNDDELLDDVRQNLGLAVLADGQVDRAGAMLERVRVRARDQGNRFRESQVLESLARVEWARRELGRALKWVHEATACSASVDDRPRVAELTWLRGVLHAERAERDEAIASASESIKLYEAIGSLHVDVLKAHLEKYRASGEWGALNADQGVPGVFVGGGRNFQPLNAATASQPTLLRMGMSLMKAAARFVGSGAKTVTGEERARRLSVCGACEHHTGARCRLCGCFTQVKTWLPHESCPIRRWERG